MPYIKEQYKELLVDDSPKNSGELNYKITGLCIEYLEMKNKCYNTINEIMGALESAKLEFYRRVAVPYEELKRKENGDVY